MLIDHSPSAGLGRKSTGESGVEELPVSSMANMVAVNLEDMVKLYSMRWGGWKKALKIP